MPRRPDLPCAGCGKLMQRGRTSLPDGQAQCRPCRGHNSRGDGRAHGLSGYRGGCRCDTCRTASTRMVREWRTRYKAEYGVHYQDRYPSHAPYQYTEAMRRRDGARRARLVGARVESFNNTEVFEQDGWVCGICSEQVDAELTFPDPLSPSLDHIVPLSLGGEHSRANVRLAHLGCNIKRGAARGEDISA